MKSFAVRPDTAATPHVPTPRFHGLSPTTAKLEDKKRRACEHLQCGRRMGDIWVQCFACCVTEQPAPKRRRRIDRSMIGNPTNFQHTAHVGSGDMSVHLNALQNQMASKGGYEYALP
ncbi:hypothetical protein HPB47_007338, partial [Ixodes persulcatus]